MNTLKILAVVASAAVAVTAEAGGRHHGGGGQAALSASGGGRSASVGRAGFARAGGIRYGGGRMIGASQRFSPYVMRSTGYRRSFNNVGASSAFNSRRVTAWNHEGNTFRQFQGGRNFSANHHNGVGSRGMNNNHVFARHSADQHRNWDHNHDHWWHGHRCHWHNGSWVIFDIGFYPWWGWGYDYGYPYPAYYPYYGSEYYNDGGYNGEVYDSAPADSYYQDQDRHQQYDSSKDYNTGSVITSAQDELARLGYYNGEIDGVYGQEMRRAIQRYQSDKGIAPNGRLNPETLDALGIHSGTARNY